VDGDPVIPLSLARIAEVTGGRLAGGDLPGGDLHRADPEAVVSGEVVIDSRRVSPGGLFAAVAGERSDGHDFAAAAVAAGAVAVLATRPVPVPSVQVADVPAALAALARSVVDALPEARIAGITGSVGKTSTKDLAAQLVERLGPTIAPAGSFNNEFGHPLTVLRADASTRYLVLELSARGLGHIAYLCRVAPPRYGVVLNVGHAHAGEFGGLDQVARAKGELPEALPADGVAILNADDPRVLAMRTRARVVTFSCAPEAAPGAAVRAADIRLDDLGRPGFTLLTPEGSAPVTLRLHGAHNVPNALAAAALARELGLDLDGIADGLRAATARSRWRMEVHQRGDGVTVINDAYNANPESVRAALDAAGRHLTGQPRGHRGVRGPAARLRPGRADRGGGGGRPAARRRAPGYRVDRGGARGARRRDRARRACEPAQALGRRTGKGIPCGAPGRRRRCSPGGGRPVKTVLLSAAVSMFVALFGTPLAIKTFSRRGYGQEIRSDGPAGHLSKRGTPTMGGTVIITASLIGYLIGHVVTGNAMSASGLLVLFLMTGLGLVGFADDFIKLYMQRSLGLRSGAKLAGQAVVGGVFALLAIRFPDGYDLTPASTHLSFYADFGISIGPVLFVVWVILMVAGTSNGVNLTDGLDGLATGAAILVLAAYMIIGIWQLRNDCTVFLAQACYDVRDPQDLAIVAATVMGACAGFLWWNAPPAKIFMGDTGSLSLGGAIAGLAITTRTELLLFLLGGLFVLITLSVVIQVGSFKLTGKRVFRMAPLQHHFELAGWAETTIVVRFWIIAGICVALGLGIFYVG
jgi:phospho-N-acetylmuramoyl-pentapeptide-transferase